MWFYVGAKSKNRTTFGAGTAPRSNLRASAPGLLQLPDSLGVPAVSAAAGGSCAAHGCTLGGQLCCTHSFTLALQSSRDVYPHATHAQLFHPTDSRLSFSLLTPAFAAGPSPKFLVALESSRQALLRLVEGFLIVVANRRAVLKMVHFASIFLLLTIRARLPFLAASRS